jgi:uncharacterized membrane protein
MSEPTMPPPPSYGAPPPPPPAAAGDNRTLWLVLSYLWPLALFPYLMEKNDADVQWHSKNGLVWTIAEFVVFVALAIINFLPVIGCVALLVMVGISLVSLVMRIVAIQKALNGDRLVLPGLSQFVNQFPG